MAEFAMRLGAYTAAVENRLDQWKQDNVINRIWNKDPLAWSAAPDAPELADRLGWLRLPESMKQQTSEILAFAEELKNEQCRHVVLLGMGGSSLAPEVFQAVYGKARGYPRLIVIDSTHPDALLYLSQPINLSQTLFIVSSKSGTTLETLSLFSYFWRQVSTATANPGSHFAAITDPGTSLAQMAKDLEFRKVFEAPPDVGGRYSALSVFGIVPAALIGIDIESALDRAIQMAKACSPGTDPSKNPGAILGAALGEIGIAGRDKITFITSPSIAAFPLWLEQLIAESTGKLDKGLIPVADEIAGPPEDYGSDRLFIGLLSSAAQESEKQIRILDALSVAGHPVLSFVFNDHDDLAGEFFRWEFATAATGAVLKINPFDQPDVQLAKDLAKKAMSANEGERALAKDELKITDVAQTAAAIKQWIQSIQSGDYIAIQAYLAQTPEIMSGVNSVRDVIRNRFQSAFTIGYGPRFLHSTGQLHKGGPNSGVFLQLTDVPSEAIPVPEKSYSFKELIKAQAEGDYQALKNRERRIIRINLGDNAPAKLSDLKKLLTQAIG